MTYESHPHPIRNPGLLRILQDCEREHFSKPWLKSLEKTRSLSKFYHKCNLGRGSAVKFCKEVIWMRSPNLNSGYILLIRSRFALAEVCALRVLLIELLRVEFKLVDAGLSLLNCFSFVCYFCTTPTLFGHVADNVITSKTKSINNKRASPPHRRNVCLRRESAIYTTTVTSSSHAHGPLGLAAAVSVCADQQFRTIFHRISKAQTLGAV